MNDSAVSTGSGQKEEDAVPWALDATIGAASIVARVAGGVVGTLARSAPAKLLGDVARSVGRPLSQEGESVRERLGGEGVPAAQGLVRRLTPGVLDAIDIDSVLGAVDVGGLVGRVDVEGVVSRVDVSGLIERVDVDRIVSRVDLDALMQRVDVAALLERIDLNDLLARIDLNDLLVRVDLNELLAGVDLDALLADVDLNAVIDRLDMDALIANTEMGAVIVRSTGGVASEALDAVRSQGVSIDSVIARVANRLLRRDVDELPTGPEALLDRPLALPPGDAPAAVGAPAPAGDAAAAADGDADGGAPAGDGDDPEADGGVR